MLFRFSFTGPLSVLLSLSAQSQWTTSGTNIYNSNTGNVGIGSTAPATKLHIASSDIFAQKIESSGSFSGFLMRSGAATKQLGFHFGSDGSSGVNTNSLRFGRYDLTGDRFGNGWQGNPAIFDLDAPDFSFVLAENGKIGLGIWDPWAKLDIRTEGVNGADQDALNIKNPSGDAYAAVTLSMGSGSFSYSTISAQRMNLTKGSSLIFRTSDGAEVAQPRMIITDAGRVGIGTLAPQSELAVKGMITSQKVKVTQTGWADYVFHNNYRLRPLPEVEQFIKQHHHLPDVPSAAEVEKEGLDLGNNQATLLKKIEELTLYVIEQHKKLEAQIKRNDEQQREIEALKKKLE